MSRSIAIVFIFFLVINRIVFGLNITIVESQSVNAGHIMDTEWSSVASGMGHTPTIVSQSTLDNTAFFSNTDILIISSGVIALPINRVNTILQFIRSGKSVYLQSEYQATKSTNQAFEAIIDSLGGSFTWTNQFYGTLMPSVIGSFSNTNNTVNLLNYFWLSVAGVGDGNMTNYLEFGGEYHGFHYTPSNPCFGSINTNADQDWIRMATSPQLMENIITQLMPVSTIYGKLALDIGNDTTLCSGDNLLLEATINNATYLWQDNSTDSVFIATQPGNYWVEVKVGNCVVSDTINIDFQSIPTVFLGNDTTVCQDEKMTLNAINPNCTYLWQDNTTDSVFIVTQSGTYWVNVLGCDTVSDTVHIQFQDCDCNFYMPNAITLNGDAINNVFLPIFNCPIEYYKLILVNKLGEKIFETNDTKNSWNGMSQNKVLLTGVYTYHLTYEFVNSNIVTKIGNLTLFR